MKLVAITLFLLIYGCASTKKVEQVSTLSIVELTPNKDSHIATQNLVHLTKIYDLTSITYFKKVHIQQGARPTHKPVILLNTRFAREPIKLLAAFIHEQFHWWLIRNPKKANALLRKIRKDFPNTRDHIHLIVCFLEYKALIHFTGKGVATQVINDFIKKEKVFPWFYQQAILNTKYFEKVLKAYQMIPSAIN